MESAQIWTTSAPWVMELQCVLKLALLVHDMNLALSNKYPLAHRHTTRTGWNPLLFKHCKAVINRSDYTVVKPPNNSITHTPTYIFSSSKVLKDIRFTWSICKLHQMLKEGRIWRSLMKELLIQKRFIYFIMGLNMLGPDLGPHK